jgi:hypothetical protein
MRKLLWITLIVSILGLATFFACSSGDDDDNDDDTASADDTGDDTAADDTGGDDTQQADDDVDDTTDDTSDDDTAVDYDFDWDTVTGLTGTLVYAGTYQGHDIVSATAIVNLVGFKADAVEWDMIDGVPAGTYDFHIDEGSNLTSDNNNYISVVFGLNALTSEYVIAFISVDGTGTITSTGVAGDTFIASATGLSFRPVDLTTGVIDWDSFTGSIGTWDIDKVITALPISK